MLDFHVGDTQITRLFRSRQYLMQNFEHIQMLRDQHET